jgi:hypothetical protein
VCGARLTQGKADVFGEKRLPFDLEPAIGSSHGPREQA